MDFEMCLEFEFLSQSDDFAWAIAFACMMADFQNALISRIFSVFSRVIVTVNDVLSHREKKTSPDYKTLILRLTDSVSLIGHVHKELTFKL